MHSTFTRRRTSSRASKRELPTLRISTISRWWFAHQVNMRRMQACSKSPATCLYHCTVRLASSMQRKLRRNTEALTQHLLMYPIPTSKLLLTTSSRSATTAVRLSSRLTVRVRPCSGTCSRTTSRSTRTITSAWLLPIPLASPSRKMTLRNTRIWSSLPARATRVSSSAITPRVPRT